jgi:hypothetical protein
MSVQMTITGTDDHDVQASSTPLATEEVFGKLWMRGALDIDAKWIPLFQSGVDVEVDDLPSICEELRALRHWAASSSMESGERSLISDRIDAALHKLDAVSGLDPKSLHIFIG